MPINGPTVGKLESIKALIQYKRLTKMTKKDLQCTMYIKHTTNNRALVRAVAMGALVSTEIWQWVPGTTRHDKDAIHFPKLSY